MTMMTMMMVCGAHVTIDIYMLPYDMVCQCHASSRIQQQPEVYHRIICDSQKGRCTACGQARACRYTAFHVPEWANLGNSVSRTQPHQFSVNQLMVSTRILGLLKRDHQSIRRCRCPPGCCGNACVVVPSCASFSACSIRSSAPPIQRLLSGVDEPRLDSAA